MPGKGRRLLVVEDEPLMANLLADALRINNFQVSIAADVLEARTVVNSFDPDAALIDISLGDGPSGLDLAHLLSVQRPDIALIILTKHANSRSAGVNAAELPDNCGFLRKDKVRDTDYLLSKIETVLSDNADRVRHDRESTDPLAALSAKQLNVLRLMAMGYTNEFIAQHSESSLSSVERWVMQIFRALDIDTRGNINPRVEAVRTFIASSSLPERV
jgi:DNA-binding NarL/FixJ family response regulator